jgi:hypothetical protein
MLRPLLLALFLPVCSCAAKHSHPDTRAIDGLLLVTGGSAHNDEAVDAWDEGGRPIATIPHNASVVRQLEKLTPSKPGCYGLVYEATFIISDEKPFRTLPFSHATLFSIARAHVSTRSDEELRQLLHKFDLSAVMTCRAEQTGTLRPIADTYRAGSPQFWKRPDGR